MAYAKHSPTAIIFPFLAQGHALPLLDLAKAFSHRGLKVTIITTPSNSKQISSIISPKFSNMISIHIIPFPTIEDLPPGCENTKDITSEDQILPFLRATLKLKEPFELYLRELMVEGGHNCRPICVVYDFFLPWALPVCSSFEIPAILFHGMGVLPTAISAFATINGDYIKGLKDEEEVEALPGLAMASPFALSRDDFPYLIDDDDPVMLFFYENEDRNGSNSCWGIVVNSFEDLEGQFVSTLESLYKEGVKVWCVGPLLLYDQLFDDNSYVGPTSGTHNEGGSSIGVSWLDQQERLESVIYVSFGTQSHVSNQQMDEIALGLEMAGYPFIWAVGSTSWVPTEGWEDRVKGKGLTIKEWVDQRLILAHPVIGGFLSHCGWNSVLESLSRGVPLLTCPMGAEQPLNTKLVVEVMRTGVAINLNKNEKGANVGFGCHDVSRGVKELMGGERGMVAREKAKEIGKMAIKAVEKGGSSSKSLDQLIKCLTEMRENV